MLIKKSYFLIVFLVFSFLLHYVVHENRDRYVQEHLDSKTDHRYSNYLVIYNNQKDIAELIFQADINRPEVIELFRDRKREELYEYLEKSYMEYKEFSIRQLHFHLPNSESFLRMHRPKKFGDKLTPIRDTVDYVIKNKKYIESFEEGKIFNGFRFVYPLFDKEEYIGSVEISLSALAFIKNFIKNYKIDSNFYVTKSIVKEKVFEDEQFHYIQSRLPDYYLEKSVVKYLKMETLKFQFNLKEINEIQSKLLIGKPFSMYLARYKEVVSFIPLKNNISSDIVGALSFSNTDSVIDDIEKNAIAVYLVSVSTLGLMLILLYKELKYKQKLEKNVRRRTEELNSANEKLKELTEKDSLTGIYNRRYLYQAAKVIRSLNKRENRRASLAMLDIDNFKSINDTYGHNKGDKVLRSFASVVAEQIRESDIFVRYGGEEFILLLPNTSVDQAMYLLEKIRVAIESSEIIKERVVTVSIGVSEFEGTTDESIHRADSAMYRAKTTGKNRVCKEEI